ncbi:MAG: hypothetical protein M1818_004377 [Claussenomyces sp. TS43310]|nr:MAG: hypothetical protein M1818_004377 [Claussenomyces sp. TS43310]
MSRDPYRSSTGELASAPPRGPQRWDAERFNLERDRSRFGAERDRLDVREDRFSRGPVPYRGPRERSVDEVHERRGPRGVEIDKFRERDFYDEPEEPRYAREPLRRPRGESITIQKEQEREYISPSPPRRPDGRPTLLRRQSSLDTFDRKPMFPRFPPREEYGPIARREAYPPPAFAPLPLPRSRALPPPRRYEREYEDIKVAEPDFYGDEEFRGYPERVREREIIRTKRRSRSRESRGAKSSRSTVRSASSSSSSSSSPSVAETIKNEYPKKGKTRMPKKLVNKAAIVALSYPFEEEGDVIIIQKALGRENIDEVIKLSEEYNKVDKVEMAGGRSEASRSEAGEVQKVSEEIIRMPPQHGEEEVIKTTKTTVERREVSPAPSHLSLRSHQSHHSHHSRSRSVGAPVIIEARPHEHGDESPPGTMDLVPTDRQLVKDERAIRAEIKALEAEKEALRAERKASREMRRADRLRREGRESGEMILYDRDEIRETREFREESRGGSVRIEKDKKVADPKALRFMLKTLT